MLFVTVFAVVDVVHVLCLSHIGFASIACSICGVTS